jgi:hypothetical protein
MRRRDLLRVLMATPLTAWLRQFLPQALAGPADGEPNAAANYERARDWLDGLGKEETEFLRECEKALTDIDHADTLIRRARPALVALREAATIGRCDWGAETLTSDDLDERRLSHSNIKLIQLACLSARRLAESGRGREAVDDAFAALTLSHRIGSGGVLIARMFECSGEVTSFRTLGRILPRLDRKTLDHASQRLDALPPPEPASATIGPESRFVASMLHAHLMTNGPKIEDEFWVEDGFDADQIASLNRLTNGTRDGVFAHLEATRPAFDELARRLDLPRPGYRQSLKEFEKAERQNHPFAAMLVEHSGRIRPMVDRMLALRVILRSAVVLLRDGEPAFLKVADPYGSGPFSLERSGKGLVIRSALHDEGMPESKLSIGENE